MKIFVGVFHSDDVSRFMQSDVSMKQKQSPYAFLILTTERAGEEEHWWSFLDLDPPKKLFLLNIFGVISFKDFITQDNQKMINKMLYGINDFNKRYNIIKII